MCGRFAVETPAKIKTIFHVKDFPEKLEPQFNIAPSQQALVILPSKDLKFNKATFMQWGLVPAWSKNPSNTFSTINARIETLALRPSYNRLVKTHRCLIPANGFYEWKKEKTKKPYYLCQPDHSLFAFVGLWDEWRNPQTKTCLFSFTILTKPAAPEILPIHDRMPVIFRPSLALEWIQSSEISLKNYNEFIQENSKVELISYEVSTEVNNPRNQHSTLIEPVNF